MTTNRKTFETLTPGDRVCRTPGLPAGTVTHASADRVRIVWDDGAVAVVEHYDFDAYTIARPTPPEISTSAARYAKGQVAVCCVSRDGFKSRAARLAEALKARYSNREHAYIMSPAKAGKLLKLYAEGWDASFFSRTLEAPVVAA